MVTEPGDGAADRGVRHGLARASRQTGRAAADQFHEPGPAIAHTGVGVSRRGR